MLKKIVLVISIIGLIFALTTCSTKLPQEQVFVQPATTETAYSSASLKVLSLNLAHGRKDGLNQLLLRESTIRDNLRQVSVVLKHTGADLVALQEADGPSRWSGDFDHVSYLAQSTGYPAYLRTSHASSWLFSYGTALLSKAPFADTVHHTFQPSPPTMNKGFTLGQITWKPDTATSNEALAVDVISVHLDFSRQAVREQQTEEISKVLAVRSNPVIVMGDFNSDWFADEKVVRALAEDSGLHVFEPDSTELGTYNSTGRRLDWILISEELEFLEYTVLSDILSDHLVIIARIGLKRSAN